jgi:rubrerythrin
MTFTIYKGLKPDGTWKIGCDQAYPNRPLEQGLTQYFAIEEHEDIMIASEREIELQKEHGVRVDGTPYWKTKVNASKAAKNALRKGTHNFQTMSKEQRSENAKRTTIFKNSEFQSEMGRRTKGIPRPHAAAFAKALNTLWTCEHCGTTGKGRGNYKRYHHDNCKQK